MENPKPQPSLQLTLTGEASATLTRAADRNVIDGIKRTEKDLHGDFVDEWEEKSK